MIQGGSEHRFVAGGGEGGRGRISLSNSRPGGRGAQRTVKVLVADDDRDTVLSLRMLLESENYEVLGVYDAPSVLRGVRVVEPDAVLLDIGMPQMTGYDIARELRRTRGNDLL